MALWLVAEHAGSEPMILTPGVAVTVGKRDVDRRDGKLSKVLFRLVMKSEEEAAVTRVGRTPVYVQPKGETGKLTMAQEGAGKSSNENWAMRCAKHHLVDELGMRDDHIVLTTCDADTYFHPQHFSALRGQCSGPNLVYR